MTRSRLALAGLVALVVTATAAATPLPSGIVRPPADWVATDVPRLGAADPALGVVTESGWKAPTAQAVLYVTRREVATDDAHRDALASAELAELDAELQRHGEGAVTDTVVKQADRTQQQLYAALSWHDSAAGLVEHNVAIVAATATTVVAVTGQCLSAIDTPAAVGDACDLALRTLQIDLAAEVRVALSIVGGGTAATGPATTAPTTDPTAPPLATAPSTPLLVPPTDATHPSMSAPQLSDGGKSGFGPIVLAPAAKPARDLRPLYVGLGVLLFAGLLYWNKQRRERFESEDGRPVRRPRAERRAARDADADDLHAAASGEPPEDEPDDR